MKLIRFLFYSLLACNIGLAGLIALPFLGIDLLTPQGEHDRLSRQLGPEKIRILPFIETGLDKDKPKLANAAASAPSSSDTPAAPPAAAQSTPAAGPVCVALTGLSTDLARQARDGAEQLGENVTTRESGTGNVSYWVHIPPGGGKEAAEHRSEILKQEGIEDYFIVREAGPNQYAVSLGLYRAEELAKRRVDALQKKGIKTARISVRDGAGFKARVDITGPGETVERFSREFSDAHKAEGVSYGACQPT